jgi:hypothetical protein
MCHPRLPLHPDYRHPSHHCVGHRTGAQGQLAQKHLTMLLPAVEHATDGPEVAMVEELGGPGGESVGAAAVDDSVDGSLVWRLGEMYATGYELGAVLAYVALGSSSWGRLVDEPAAAAAGSAGQVVAAVGPVELVGTLDVPAEEAEPVVRLIVIPVAFVVVAVVAVAVAVVVVAAAAAAAAAVAVAVAVVVLHSSAAYMPADSGIAGACGAERQASGGRLPPLPPHVLDSEHAWCFHWEHYGHQGRGTASRREGPDMYPVPAAEGCNAGAGRRKPDVEAAEASATASAALRNVMLESRVLSRCVVEEKRGRARNACSSCWADPGPTYSRPERVENNHPVYDKRASIAAKMRTISISPGPVKKRT